MHRRSTPSAILCAALNILAGLFGPLKGLIGGLSPFRKGLRGFVLEILSRKIDRKLSEKQVKNLQNTSSKLLKKKNKIANKPIRKN